MEIQENSREKPKNSKEMQIYGAAHRRSADRLEMAPPASARQSVSVTFMRCGGWSGSRPRRRAVASATW